MFISKYDLLEPNMTPRFIKVSSRIGAISSIACSWFASHLYESGGKPISINSGVFVHVVAAYTIATLCIVSLPNRRRTDIGLLLVIVCAIVEVTSAGLVRSVPLWIGDVTGISMLIAPVWIERVRSVIRNSPDHYWAAAMAELNQSRRRPPDSVVAPVDRNPSRQFLR